MCAERERGVFIISLMRHDEKKTKRSFSKNSPLFFKRRSFLINFFFNKKLMFIKEARQKKIFLIIFNKRKKFFFLIFIANHGINFDS